MEFNTLKDNPDVHGVRDIDPQEVWDKRSNLVLIDVRRPDEFSGEQGHIPGAKLIVLNTLAEHLDEIPKDKAVVFICLSGGRSARACEFVQREGYNDVYNMRGGMLAWNQRNLTTET